MYKMYVVIFVGCVVRVGSSVDYLKVKIQHDLKMFGPFYLNPIPILFPFKVTDDDRSKEDHRSTLEERKRCCPKI